VHSDFENSPAVLFVSPARNRQNVLAESVELLGLEALSARRCHEARALLRDRSGIQVVVVDVTLPDGNWCDVLRWMIERRIKAGLILISPVSDAALWSEAVWRGAYDVLVEPFASWEFSRSVEGALRNRFPQGQTSAPLSGAIRKQVLRHDASRKQARTSGPPLSSILPAVSPA